MIVVGVDVYFDLNQIECSFIHSTDLSEQHDVQA